MAHLAHDHWHADRASYEADGPARPDQTERKQGEPFFCTSDRQQQAL